MEEITKKAVRFTELGSSTAREELLEDLCEANMSVYKNNYPSVEYQIVFDSGTYRVSEEDYNWCADYLKRKAKKQMKNWDCNR